MITSDLRGLESDSAHKGGVSCSFRSVCTPLLSQVESSALGDTYSSQCSTAPKCSQRLCCQTLLCIRQGDGVEARCKQDMSRTGSDQEFCPLLLGPCRNRTLLSDVTATFCGKLLEHRLEVRTYIKSQCLLLNCERYGQHVMLIKCDINMMMIIYYYYIFIIKNNQVV